MGTIDYDHELKKIKSTKKLRELHSEFMTLTRAVLLEYNNCQNTDLYKRIYQNLLQRLYIGICAIDSLFDKFNKNSYYKFPIAIQMRVCILDSITIAYLRLFINKLDPTRFKEQIIRLNHPSARELMNEIEYKLENENLKPYETEKYYKLATTQFPDNFTDGSIPKLKKNIKDLKPKAMADALIGTELEWYHDIYKTYQYYSKYEHYGTLTKALLEFSSEYEFDKLTMSTFYVFQAAFMASACLELDQNKIEKFKNLRDRIIEVNPTFDIKKYLAQTGSNDKIE